MKTIKTILVMAMLAGCGGDVAGIEAASLDAGSECGIHETLEYPSYFGPRGGEFALLLDSGVVEDCVDNGTASGWYLCSVQR